MFGFLARRIAITAGRDIASDRQIVNPVVTAAVDAYHTTANTRIESISTDGYSGALNVSADSMPTTRELATASTISSSPQVIQTILPNRSFTNREYNGILRAASSLASNTRFVDLFRQMRDDETLSLPFLTFDDSTSSIENITPSNRYSEQLNAEYQQLSSELLSGMRYVDFQDKFCCTICYNVLAAPVTTVACTHSFCGNCMDEYISYHNTNPQRDTYGAVHPCECPNCRTVIELVTAPPIFVPMLDELIETYMTTAPEVEKENWNEKRRKYLLQHRLIESNIDDDVNNNNGVTDNETPRDTHAPNTTPDSTSTSSSFSTYAGYYYSLSTEERLFHKKCAFFVAFFMLSLIQNGRF